ncbi:MAG: hypothetical protein IJU29_08375 [Oscillospiraceae bacterium]|nr:hypothetical protein [Oscillospiraceae bacterium]
MAKKEKPPKVKKEKPPKVKKEKPPKVKKEKPPKVKKQGGKKKGPDIGNGQVENLLTGEMEGGEKKKGGKKKLLLILIPIVVLAAAGGVLVFTGVLDRDSDVEEPEIVDTAETEPSGEGGEGGGEGEGVGEPGEPEEPEEPEEPASTPGRYLTDIQTNMTTADIVTYMNGLSPEVLGLEGTDMTAYEVYPSEGVTLVDGLTCSRVQVYSRGEQSGTNDVEGVYYITRSGARRLYRYDVETGLVTEVELPQPTLPPTPEPAEGEEGAEDGEEEEAAEASGKD